MSESVSEGPVPAAASTGSAPPTPTPPSTPPAAPAGAGRGDLTRSSSESSGESSGESSATAAGSGGETSTKPRRRGSRGGRSRSRSGGPGAGEGSSNGDDADSPPAVTGDDRNGATPRSRARSGEARNPDELPERSIEGRPRTIEAAEKALVRRPRIGDSRPAPESEGGATDADSAPSRSSGGGRGAASDATTADKTPGKRRRGGRGRGGGGGTPGGGSGGDQARRGSGRGGAKAPKPVQAIAAEPYEIDEETAKRRGGRERKGRPVGRYLMTVSVRPTATQIAVLEGRSLIEHYVSRPADDEHQIHGNIYLGRVQNVLPGMEAAFVDISTPKNAVLYRGDVQYDAEDIEEKGANPRIEHLLKAKQTIICQVTKNPIAHKGARLTQEVSIPGRFVVLIPNSTTYGISKRLADDERKRLRAILDRVRPKGHGIIVRTAAEGVSAEEIERDVARLSQQWTQIEALAAKTTGPALLYREPDMAVRVIREEFNQDYRGVIIDDRALFEEVRDYVAGISPALADRVEFYDPEVEPLPLYERHHIHEQLHKALDRKVWLPSGGSLIIEHTEALTVIDVNTGKNVGTSSLEETVFRNNLEAAIEVAKQLRLRDIGGIVVIDFIDMEIRDNREQVIGTFRDALARDKTRTQVFDISELGLVEMTRKRIGEGLLESFSTLCPECEGRGLILDADLLI
jgi:ribonuclease E